MFLACCMGGHARDSEIMEEACLTPETADVAEVPEKTTWASEPAAMRERFESEGSLEEMDEEMDSRADSKASTAASETDLHDAEVRSLSIQKTTEMDIFTKYQLEGETVKTNHRGVFLMFGSRASDGVSVVLKIFSKIMAFGGSSSEERKWREQAILQLSMPKSGRLCETMDVLETDKRYYLVMEKVEGRDLFQWQSGERFGHAHAREIMRQVLQGVRDLHGAGCLHRDLKLDNVVSNSGSKVSAKIIDFDTAVTCQQSGVTEALVVGTYSYCAPESFKGYYSTSSDMYSAGVIMYRLLTSCMPMCPYTFDAKFGENAVGNQAMQQIHSRIATTQIDFSALDVCPEAAALCKCLLALDPQKRMSAEDALAHEWFALEGNLPEIAGPAQPAQPAAPRKGKFTIFGRSK